MREFGGKLRDVGLIMVFLAYIVVDSVREMFADSEG